MPTWRAWILITGVAFAVTLALAWKKVPGFQDAVRGVLGDAKANVAKP